MVNVYLHVLTWLSTFNQHCSGGGGGYGIPASMANAARYARLQNTGSITAQPSFHTLVLSIRPLQFSLNSIIYVL